MAFAVMLAGLWPALDAGTGLGDSATRTAAIVRLGTMGRPADLSRIATFLDSGDPSLRLAAARVLVRAGDRAALARMAAQATDARAPPRFEALTVLREAAFLPVEGRRAAERALADSDPAIRLVALDLLAMHPSIDSVTAVTASLSDGNRDVRLSAISLLGQTPDPRALMPLLERSDTPDRTERIAILQALGGFAHVHPRLDAGPAVLQQASDINDDVRVAAVDALGRLGWAAAVPVLRALASRPAADPRASRRATLALGAIGGAAAIAALVELLREPAPGDEVSVALKRAGGQAVQPVAAVLGNGFTTSAIAAATLLGQLGDRGATPALTRALKTRPAVAIGAARALEKLRDEAAVPALLDAVTGPTYARSPGVREACLNALASIGDPRAAPAVEATVGDRDPRTRAAALELAAALHLGLSRTTLISRLQDAAPLVRAAAIKAASGFPGLDVGPEVLRALPSIASLDSTARARLCVVLARTRLPAADAYLADFLERDPDDGVRAAAAWAARSRRDVPAITAALAQGRNDRIGAVAANATAAIETAAATVQAAAAAQATHGGAAGDSAAPSLTWIVAHVVSREGLAVAGKWLRVHVGQQIVWTRTDDRGEAMLMDLPGAEALGTGGSHYRVSLAPDDHDVLTAATASGRSPATTPTGP